MLLACVLLMVEDGGVKGLGVRREPRAELFIARLMVVVADANFLDAQRVLKARQIYA